MLLRLLFSVKRDTRGPCHTKVISYPITSGIWLYRRRPKRITLVLQVLIALTLNVITAVPLDSLSGSATLVLLGGGLLGAGTGLRKLLNR